MKIKEYRLATLRYDKEKNILFYRINQDQIIDTAEVKEMILYAEDLIGRKKHYAVVDFGEGAMSSKEARGIYQEADYITQYRMANAFVAKSLQVKLILNHFINSGNLKVKTMLFENEIKALEWIDSLISKN